MAYDISAIDFERLRQEFAGSTTQNTHVQNLKAAIEKRLARILAQNPLRTDFQQHYEQLLIADYNREKDRVTIEKTFDALLKFVSKLDDEQARALREGLDEPTLALFDLLKKEELTPANIRANQAGRSRPLRRDCETNWPASAIGSRSRRPEIR